MHKPLVAIGAAVSMLLPIAASAASFSDVPADAWYEPFVREASELGIVEGYAGSTGQPTGFYGPGDGLTIAQALKLIVKSAGYDVPAYVEYCRRTPECRDRREQWRSNAWYEPYRMVALANGFDEILFWNPDTLAERRLVARMLKHFFGGSLKPNSGGNPYRDVEADSYQSDILIVTDDGIMSGDTDASGMSTGTFRPFDWLRRSEGAKVAVNAYHVYRLDRHWTAPLAP